MSSWHIKFGLSVMALAKNFFFGARAKNNGIFFYKSNLWMSQQFQQVSSQFQRKIAWSRTPDYLQRQKYWLNLNLKIFIRAFIWISSLVLGDCGIGPLEEMITVTGTRQKQLDRSRNLLSLMICKNMKKHGQLLIAFTCLWSTETKHNKTKNSLQKIFTQAGCYWFGSPKQNKTTLLQEENTTTWFLYNYMPIGSKSSYLFHAFPLLSSIHRKAMNSQHSH